MTQPIIYYFSSTGNSLFTAKQIGKAVNAEIYSIPDVLDNPDHTDWSGKTVGLIFPLYDFKAPSIVEKFISNIQNIKDSELNQTYIFAAATYGLSPVNAFDQLNRLIKGKNGKLSAGFGFKMPHNGIACEKQDPAGFPEMDQMMISQIPEIKQIILHKEQVPFDHTSYFNLLKDKNIYKMLPYLFKFLSHLILHGADSIGFRADKEKCTGCGICQKICPVDNIELKDGLPVWKDECMNCFGCLHWCPENAVGNGRIDLGIRQYRHSGIEVRDLLRNNQQK